MALNANAKEFSMENMFERKDDELLGEIIEYNDLKNHGIIKLINGEKCKINKEQFIIFGDINNKIVSGWYVLTKPNYSKITDSSWSKDNFYLETCTKIRPIKCFRCNGFGHFGFNCKKL